MPASRATAPRVLKPPMRSANPDSNSSLLLRAKSLPRALTRWREPAGSTDMGYPENIPQGVQLVTMAPRDPLYQARATRGEMNFDTPRIPCTAALADHIEPHTAA